MSGARTLLADSYYKGEDKTKIVTKDDGRDVGGLFVERGVAIMEITDVRMRKVDKLGKLKGIASITIDNEFVIHDIKVIDGDKGLFIAMPSKKSVDGEYRDIAHPINSGVRSMMQEKILNAYEKSQVMPFTGAVTSVAG